jgi:hypothetical protein
MLDATVNWLVALLFGAALVIYNSWYRFDEPSYDSQTECFAKYKPRFSTYRDRFIRAKYEYISVFLLAYLIFSFVPEIFFAVISPGEGGNTPQSPMLVPVIVALALANLQRAPMTQAAERRIRATFHALAQIPEGVRRTVTQIRTCDYNRDPVVVSNQTQKIAPPAPDNGAAPEIMRNIANNDELTAVWIDIGCLLESFNERNSGKLGIDSDFLDSYHAELDGIDAEHRALIERVQHHLRFPRPGVVNDSDAPLLDEIRNLRRCQEASESILAR